MHVDAEGDIRFALEMLEWELSYLVRSWRRDEERASLLRARRELGERIAAVARALGGHEQPVHDPWRIAHDGFLSAIAMVQLLDDAIEKHSGSRAIIERSRIAVESLLDVLTPHVRVADRGLRDMFVDGEPLERALARMKCA